MGSSFVSSGGQVLYIIQFVIHPSYQKVVLKDNDIAIVRLKETLVLSDTANVISIAAPDYNLPDGRKVTAVGFGALMVSL